MVLEVKNISYSMGKRHLFDNINFKLTKGLTLLKGESGSGKTTLLRIINRLIKPKEGSIFFSGSDISAVDEFIWRSVCMMMKQKGFYIAETPLETLMLPFEFKNNRKKSFDAEEVYHLLALFGLRREILYDKASNLSGGELQRIAFIRLLILKPDVALFDEPVSAVDNKTAENMLGFLKEYCNNRICLITSHDPVAYSFADRIIELKNGKVVDG
ncbi:ABC transporter ATP-binding protein [Hippea jasoniae]|uniref:ABC transporter ATP-binding protein n=1 Tax=Hippea jasoniae TaxID=944479 RepID=UPI0005594E05|nr:ATP-binding cassette domain-containing protein [Hippea jasoniae]